MAEFLQGFYPEICLITALCVIAISWFVLHKHGLIGMQLAILHIGAAATVVSGYCWGLVVASGVASVLVWTFVTLRAAARGWIYNLYGLIGVVGLGAALCYLVYWVGRIV